MVLVDEINEDETSVLLGLVLSSLKKISNQFTAPASRNHPLPSNIVFLQFLKSQNFHNIIDACRCVCV